MDTTEKAKFLASVEEKRGMGLKDLKFFTSVPQNASEEAFYGELNRLDSATDLPDPQVLGRHSQTIVS